MLTVEQFVEAVNAAGIDTPEKAAQFMQTATRRIKIAQLDRQQAEAQAKLREAQEAANAEIQAIAEARQQLQEGV